MLPYRDSRFTALILAIFFVLALGYALFEARGVLLGPTITISDQVSEVHEQFVVLKGQAERIASLSMNGAPVQVTKDGAFAKGYLLAPGYNRIVLDAKDQYGRSRQRVIEIIYTPSSTPSPFTNNANASSTPAALPAPRLPGQEAGSSTAPMAQ